MIRTALIGYGVAGEIFHAPLINSCAGMELTAIVTRNKDRQAVAQKKYPGVKILISAQEIWSRPHLYDLVVIATTNDTHAKLATKSIEVGLATVVDKPFALSVQEASGLILLSKAKNVLLSVFHNRRFDNDFLTVQNLIKSNQLGTIIRLESRFERYRPTPRLGNWRELTSIEMGGGLLNDLGSHLIDQAIVLFGQPISVYAELKTRRENLPSDDDTFLALQFANNICVHLWASLLVKVPSSRFRLIGTNGIYEKFGLDPQEDALRMGLTPGSANWGVENLECAGKLTTMINDVEINHSIISEPGCYNRYYEQMREAILGKGVVPVDPADAQLGLAVIEEARKSFSC